MILQTSTGQPVLFFLNDTPEMVYHSTQNKVLQRNLSEEERTVIEQIILDLEDVINEV